MLQTPFQARTEAAINQVKANDNNAMRIMLPLTC